MKNNILHLDWGYIDESYKPDFLPDLLKMAMAEKPFNLLQYGDPYGLTELRAVASSFIEKRLNIHNVQCTDLVVTNGATAALDLVARVILKNQYDSVVLEPVFNSALECLRINSRKVYSITFTDSGRITQSSWHRLEELLKRKTTKLIYTIPNYNNPNGAVLSGEDRVRLLEMCQKYEVFIVEDDPYTLYNFNKVKLPESIVNFDIQRRYTIYITTTSKLLYPGLRIGFVVANKAILDRIANVQKFTTSSANLLSQGIMLHAFRENFIEKAILHYQEIIGRKKTKILEEIAKSNISKFATISPFFGGFYLWLKFGDTVDTTALVDSFSKLGISYVPGSIYFMKNDQHNYMRLAFSQIKESDIKEAIHRLDLAITKFCALRSEKTYAN